MKIISTFLVLIFLCSSYIGYAQTCCSGGVPVSGNLGMPLSNAKTLQFNLSYDYNNLNTLKSNRIVLDDNSRKRTTHSILFETGYSFNERFSADVFFSYVRQERLINNNNNEDFTYTQGVGDVVVLLKYLLVKGGKDKSNIVVGGGVKLPVGVSDKLNSQNGLPLNADLQPGSGAFDFIGWGAWSKPTQFRPSMSYFSTVIFSYKGINNSYLGENSYQFGRELSWSVGIGDQLFLASQIVEPSIQVRYRSAQADLFNSDELPSTGGDWLFVTPGISFWPNPNFAIEANIELPLVARVEGTQVTPTRRFNIGFYYKFQLSKDKTNITPTINLNDKK